MHACTCTPRVYAVTLLSTKLASKYTQTHSLQRPLHPSIHAYTIWFLFRHAFHCTCIKNPCSWHDTAVRELDGVTRRWMSDKQVEWSILPNPLPGGAVMIACSVILLKHWYYFHLHVYIARFHTKKLFYIFSWFPVLKFIVLLFFCLLVSQIRGLTCTSIIKLCTPTPLPHGNFKGLGFC